jgi:hypothetical protein
MFCMFVERIDRLEKGDINYKYLQIKCAENIGTQEF